MNSSDAPSSPQQKPSQQLPTGRYRHYKGGEYRVLGVARHSENEEELVVYQPLYGERGLWVRPLAMFIESVETPQGMQPRFLRVSEPG
tara:strand:- start:3694 stop:3957 length:264 start_codon:yes stop_codon:yes gene_type:complete